MAVIGSLRRGTDASYPFRAMATEAAAGHPLNYYLSPAESGGEPPGRWAGENLARLGFRPGQVVERAVFVPLYEQHADPRDPSGSTRLGNKPQQFASWGEIYEGMLAAEPAASPARRAELKAQAKAATRHAVPFWDWTVSLSKTISLAHGGYLAAAERARQSGDEALARRREWQAGRVIAAAEEANAAGLAYYQREAGITRAGYHRGSGAESRAELGRFEDARKWVIGTFLQHTSRSGDPQLHFHNLILNKVETERDDKWRKLDSKTLYRYRRAASEIAAAHLEAALTRSLGVAWVPGGHGQGLEIAGIGKDLIDAFSTRTRHDIDPASRQVAAERESETGQRPSAWQMSRIRQDVTLQTRQAKPETPFDQAASLKKWEATAREQDLGDLAAIPEAIDAAAAQIRDQEQAQQTAAEQAAAGYVRQVAHAIGAEYTREHGAAPDAEQIARIERFARFITLRGADTRPVEPALLLQAFEAQQRADAQAERDIRREIARIQALAGPPPATSRARAVAYPVHGARGLTEGEARQAMAQAVAALAAKKARWTRADLIAAIGQARPAGAAVTGTVLETLADRALAGDSGERVELLSAPEWPRVPGSLRRANGESVFRPHGAELYASQAQLTLEERLLAQAQAPAAPPVAPDAAAAMLGASRQRLEAQLRPDAPTTAAALNEVTGSGLRMDQAAAAYFILTSPRRAEVMIGPAGTGKTRTASELARIWAAAGTGPVVALTTSSNARNVIREEAARNGVTLAAYNTAEWLGHTEDQREARPPVELVPGSLIILDEASMMSLPDLAAVIRRAAQHGAKVVVTGDPMQLQAVENGGGMTMLARRNGHVQLSEAGRFTHLWEREATLRLRRGDVTVFADYNQHDRLHLGHGEEILEDAARAYLHERLSGKDTLLMAGTDAMAAELSRRIRGDLIQWGIVSDGPSVTVMNGYQASTGDWIIARKNNSLIDAGQEGRKLANRDVLRIVNIDPDGTGRQVQVERLIARDQATGGEMWSVPFELNRSYLWRWTQLAYAVTFHTGEGRTVDSGISVFTGDEDRQAVNVGLTRGRDRNDAYVISGWRIADPRPGTQPAPELARQDRLDRERAGLAIREDAEHDQQGPHEQATAEQVLAACLDRDGQQMSATETRQAEWSDADRLDVLGAQWQHVDRQASQQRFQQALHAALPADLARQVMNDPAATWLWRSLREAEAAGLDGMAALRHAVAAGPLADAQSVAKVIDWRVRQHTTGMPALPSRPWAEQVRQTGDPDMDRYWRELAEAMTDRQRRLGEHAAEHQPAWTQPLGPVPDHPVDRADWEHKASLVAAYREMWGYTHLHNPIGPKPGQHSPEARASWQAAAQALGYTPGDMREHSDGQLWAWRSVFAREMAWAPDYKGDDLAVVRRAIRDAEIETGRARRNAEAADTDAARERLEYLASVQAAWEQATRELAGRLTEAQAGYDAWEAVTSPARERAVAADAELRRRHPDDRIKPLSSIQTSGEETPGPKPAPEPAQPTQPEAAQPLSLHDELSQMGWFGPAEPAPEPNPAEATPRADLHSEADITRQAPAANAAQPEPATTDWAPHDAKMAQIQQQVREISAKLDDVAMQRARQAREKAAEATSITAPPGNPDAVPAAAWIDDLQSRQREAVRHEPMPRVPGAEAIKPPEPSVSAPEAGD